MPSTPPPAPAPPPFAWVLALVVAVAVLVGGAFAVDRAGERLLGSHARATQAGTQAITPGGRVLLGNSVAQSAITVENLEAALDSKVVDLTDPGGGPTTWYVQVTHYLARAERVPKEVIIAAPPGWFARSTPIQDASIALELSQWDDPVLAELLHITVAELAIQRRVTSRTRVRDAWIQLLGRPWGQRLARSAHRSEDPLSDPLDSAVERTLHQTGAANTRRGAAQGPGAALVDSRMYAEADPGLVALAGAAERAGILLILAVLPERRDGKVLFASSIIISGLPASVKFADLSGVQLPAAAYTDSVHFSPDALTTLSPAFARAIAESSHGSRRVRAYTALPVFPARRPPIRNR